MESLTGLKNLFLTKKLKLNYICPLGPIERLTFSICKSERWAIFNMPKKNFFSGHVEIIFTWPLWRGLWKLGMHSAYAMSWKVVLFGILPASCSTRMSFFLSQSFRKLRTRPHLERPSEADTSILEARKCWVFPNPSATTKDNNKMRIMVQMSKKLPHLKLVFCHIRMPSR
jgi:hypothetical protein